MNLELYFLVFNIKRTADKPKVMPCYLLHLTNKSLESATVIILLRWNENGFNIERITWILQNYIDEL